MLKHRWFLYATEFFAGMVVMAVELGASRLLAPYFSSSQIIWTIIIGMIMIAMALGNIWGGRMADRHPEPDRLYGRLLVAGVWIAAIPFAGKLVIAGVSLALAFVAGEGFLIWASLFSCLILFVFPLLLLGTVTPALVKFAVSNLDQTGRIVGRLGALNTIGSIIGTFLPTFVTIPTWGTSATFLVFSGILLLLCGSYFISVRKRLLRCAVSVLLASALGATACIFPLTFGEGTTLYEGESLYNYLRVSEDDQAVTLSTNVLIGTQSLMMKSDSLTGMYYDYAMAAPLMAGAKEKGGCDILILGMGTGTFATQCLRYLDGVAVEGVEIDAKIADLAKEYFNLPENASVTVADGRAFLAGNKKKYDVILVDAYHDITIPFQLSSKEFFSLVKSRLTENGVMAVNMCMVSPDENSINAYLCDTIRSVFGYAYTVKVQNCTNEELFASESPSMKETLDRNTALLGDQELSRLMGRVSGSLVPVESGGHILTDDKAPVELLGMKALDEIVKSELTYYREILKKDGIRGLLNQM